MIEEYAFNYWQILRLFLVRLFLLRHIMPFAGRGFLQRQKALGSIPPLRPLLTSTTTDLRASQCV